MTVRWVLVAMLATGCGSVDAPAHAPMTLLYDDERFDCRMRNIPSPVSKDRPGIVTWSTDRTEFACGYLGQDFVVYIGSVERKQMFWIMPDIDDRAALVTALGEVLGWNPDLVAAAAVTRDGGSVGGDAWHFEHGGVMAIAIDDPARVT